MADTLNVAVRELLGTNHTRRLRKTGQIPAILYGHGEQSLSLSISATEVVSAIRRGTKVVEIRGAVSESALIREVQWDAFGSAILHVDLTRVSADEKVEVTVAIELRGEAPGTREGGIIEFVTHEVAIECAASLIPEKLTVSVNNLHIGQSITAAELELPQGARLVSLGDLVVVHCVEPVAEIEGAEVPGGEGAEPEVIGGRKEEEGEEE